MGRARPEGITLQLLIQDSQAFLEGILCLLQGVLGLVVVIDVQVGAANGGPGPLLLNVVGEGTCQLQVAVLVLGAKKYGLCEPTLTASKPHMSPKPPGAGRSQAAHTVSSMPSAACRDGGTTC